MQAPSYSASEAMGYVGAMVGIGACYAGLGYLGVTHQLARGLGSIAFGVAFGWLLERLYRGASPPRDGPGDRGAPPPPNGSAPPRV